MTSTKSMLAAHLSGRWAWIVLALLAALGPTGCKGFSKPQLTPPTVLQSPYGQEGGEVLWAVAPLRNESGTTLADPMVMTDKVIAAVAETRGIRCLPLNRSLEAMRTLEMSAVRSPADALALAKTLGVDGILVGSITAYEPYQPTLGLSLALFGRPGAMHTQAEQQLDARALTSRPSEPPPSGQSNFGQRPLSAVSEHLDGKNHQVLLDAQEYGQGRSDPTSSLGWRRYVASMDLYMEFAAHHTLGRLIHEEWRRLGGSPDAAKQK